MIGSFIRGITIATLNWKMVLVLLFANIIFALPVALPMFMLVLQTAGNSIAAEKMLSDKLDVDWVTDVVNLQMSGSSFDATGLQTAALLAVAALVYLLITTLLSGGILAVFASEDQRFTMREFWAGCGQYFWRFFRLMLISLFFYAAAIAIYSVIYRWTGRIDDTATAYESVVYKRWTGIAVLLLMLSAVNMLFDYARIGAVINNSRKMFRQTFSALTYTLRHFFSAFTLYLLIGIIGLAVMALLVWLRGSINQSSLPAVALAILVGQLTIASRMWTRMAAFAGQMDLYRRLAPPVIVPVKSIEPDEYEEDTVDDENLQVVEKETG